MKLFAFFTMLFGSSVVAQTAEEPLSFTVFGAYGVSLAILVFILRDVMKQRDRAVATLELVVPVMTETKAALVTSNEIHIRTVEELRNVNRALERVPTEEVWTRLKVALESTERRR